MEEFFFVFFCRSDMLKERSRSVLSLGEQEGFFRPENRRRPPHTKYESTLNLPPEEAAVNNSPPAKPESQPQWFAETMAALLARRELSDQQMRLVIRDLMLGNCGDVETAAFLTALRMKGETAGELAAAAAVLREHMIRFEAGSPDVLDTCGMGGDETGTFNISTATAFLAAGAGVAVVKHGNRAVSSHSGSADVLAALGVALKEDLAWAQRSLAQAGLAFCFAPHFHPALRHVAPVRRRLRIRTLFNCLGPLANPAGAVYQLLGVARPELLDPLAGALARLGTRRAFLVCGNDGLDEVSLSGPTLVREVRSSKVVATKWLPGDFGLAPVALAELQVSGSEESAAVIRSILDGREGPPARVAIANAAAALLAAELVETLPEGVARAQEAISSGRARQVLERLIAC
jgi:anthranilate phosphoribosyltransferase